MSTVQIAAFVIASAAIQFVLFRTLAHRIPAFASVVLGAVLSVGVYQAWVYFDLGYVEPFFQVAAVVQFGTALLIGLVIVLIRRSYSKASAASP